jgi:hypothetical protein
MKWIMSRGKRAKCWAYNRLLGLRGLWRKRRRPGGSRDRGSVLQLASHVQHRGNAFAVMRTLSAAFSSASSSVQTE